MKTFLKLIKTHKWIDRNCMGGYSIDSDGVWVYFKAGFFCSCCECICDIDESGTCHTDTIQDAIKCIKNGVECGCKN